MISSFTFLSPTRHLQHTNLSAEWEAPNKSHQDKTASSLRQKFHTRGAFLMHLIQCNSLCDPVIYTEAGHLNFLDSDYAFHWMLQDYFYLFHYSLSVLKAFA